MSQLYCDAIQLVKTYTVLAITGMVGIDDSSIQDVTGGLMARVSWLGLRFSGSLAPFCVHQLNRVNSHKHMP